jgi:hypothetical protein
MDKARATQARLCKGTNTVTDGAAAAAGELGSAHPECMRGTVDLVVPKYTEEGDSFERVCVYFQLD